ncbi:DUF2285 domain-containing protein [Inquilinus sp. Marseille-Q2685]|uniref:DUF2285 domain-containing protein n=1 Tax=Inquilinus sp. Marseille-Q2685 TaxID=2866581 RepID=UPI001CE4985B|nr:DUF2285 domain-containing protein [Inquilinus sp. Marseille-Q2685]
MFWLPELHARTVILTPSLPDPPIDAIVFDPDAWFGAVAERRSADGLHLLLRDGRSTHRLWLPGPPARGTAVDSALSLDVTAPLRAEATLRFWRLLREGRPQAPPILPTQRRDRLVASLRALDGRSEGASYREIAEVLFGADRIREESWKTSSIRDRTIRLVRSGLALMRGGYRRLLGPRR